MIKETKNEEAIGFIEKCYAEARLHNNIFTNMQIVAGVGLIFLIYMVFFDQSNPPDIIYMSCKIFMGITLFLIFYWGIKKINYDSKKLYYLALRETVGKEDHYCIHCGSKGIWRKGIYQSDAVICNCSKCKTFLFYE